MFNAIVYTCNHVTDAKRYISYIQGVRLLFHRKGNTDISVSVAIWYDTAGLRYDTIEEINVDSKAEYTA